MAEKMLLPQTLEQAIRYFTDEEVCVQLVADLRWPKGVSCQHCTSKNVAYVKSRRIWQCKDCRKQFSVKVGTIFEDSPIRLSKWMAAMWLIVNAKNGISSYEISRALGVTQKTAWFMLHRIRLALQRGSLSKKLRGVVEVDETYIGGLARNMHKDKRAKAIKGTGGMGKIAVMGLLERNGEVRAHVIANTTKKALQAEVRKHIESGSNVFTDDWKGYRGLTIDYAHRVINHAEKYVDGIVHTNGIENFWSLLKRGLKGTYISVEPFHLFRYLDEQAYRFNLRENNDQERFLAAVSTIHGRRVTYPQLIGQTTH